MLVALCRRGLGRRARYGAGTRRHDARRLGMARGDPAIDTFLIIRAVAGQRGDRSVYLVEQGTNLRAVIGILIGQLRRNDLPSVGIHAEVELSPRPARAGAVLLDQPLARATQ